MIRPISAALVLSSALLLGACGDDNDPSAPADFTENFTFTVTGDVTGSHSGAAYFGVDTESTEPVFGIVLANATESQALLLTRTGTTPPTAGEYDLSLGEDAEWTAIYVLEEAGVFGAVAASEGTLTITRSTSGRLTGTVQMEGVGVLVDEESEVAEDVAVTISGTFDAKPVE